MKKSELQKMINKELLESAQEPMQMVNLTKYINDIVKSFDKLEKWMGQWDKFYKANRSDYDSYQIQSNVENLKSLSNIKHSFGKLLSDMEY